LRAGSTTTGYVTLLSVCELLLRRKHGCPTFGLHQGRTKISGMFFVGRRFARWWNSHALCAQYGDNIVSQGSIYE